MIEIFLWAVLIWNSIGALGTALQLLDSPTRNTIGLIGLVVQLGFVFCSGFLIYIIREL